MTFKPDKIDIFIQGAPDSMGQVLTLFTPKSEYRACLIDSEADILERNRKNMFFIFLMDMDNGGISNLDFLQQFRTERASRPVPVICISKNDPSESDILAAIDAGAMDYINYAEAPTILLAKIDAIVSMYRHWKSYGEKTEERLKNSEMKYKSLFETSRDGIVFLSLDGQIENANAAYCSMLGYNLNELIFMNWQDHTPNKWWDKDREILESQVLARDYSDEYKKEFIRKDGTIFPAMARIWLVKDPQGIPLRLLKLVRDVTDQNRLETQLRQAQKMESIGTLAGGIAHDFNNILGAIIGYAQLAKYNLKGNDAALQDIEHVLTASNRAKDLVKHILGFSRMTEHSMQPIQLHHIVKEALKLIRASLPSTIEIRQEISTQGTTILADPTEVHQVLMNFCTNSLHAMEKAGGILDVTLQPIQFEEIDQNEHPGLKPCPYIRLEVSDTGCGIDPRFIERIFDPYFTTKKKGTGTGLGLAVAHGIIKTHGGSVNVKSRLGEGTVMTVLLPRLDTVIEKVMPSPETLPGGKETILFVDDEKSLVEIEKVMLQRLGYTVISEYSSVNAYKTFLKNPEKFDMVITDMTMPEMTGIELSRGIASKKPGIPIILCTGYNNKITHEKAKDAGIGSLLLKPVEIRELAETIRRLLD